MRCRPAGLAHTGRRNATKVLGPEGAFPPASARRSQALCPSVKNRKTAFPPAIQKSPCRAGRSFRSGKVLRLSRHNGGGAAAAAGGRSPFFPLGLGCGSRGRRRGCAGGMVGGSVGLMLGFLGHNHHLETVLQVGKAAGYISLSRLATPRPTTWLGRQPKGCRMMKLRQPFLAWWRISAGIRTPSPASKVW